MTEYIERDPKTTRSAFVITDRRQKESLGLDFLNSNSFASCESCSLRGGGCGGGFLSEPVRIVNKSFPEWESIEEKDLFLKKGSYKLNVLALGDVGGTMLTGLRLLGGDILSGIGIFDINEKNIKRWEFEANQIFRAFHPGEFPEVRPITEDKLFDCDVFVFTASGGIPPVGSGVKDVRMAQLEVNKKIVGIYARKAREAGFKGRFFVVSDPVDNLCAHVYQESNRDAEGNWDQKGLRPEQIQGFGLGVMNARAVYYASKDDRMEHYPVEGRVFGPHGKDLIVADSIVHYNHQLSLELTDKVVNANMELREVGFKPYVAPALSSAALSILDALRGEWHYGSVFLDGVYMGVKNRYSPLGQETELIPMAPALFERIKLAADNLRQH